MIRSQHPATNRDPASQNDLRTAVRGADAAGHPEVIAGLPLEFGDGGNQVVVVAGDDQLRVVPRQGGRLVGDDDAVQAVDWRLRCHGLPDRRAARGVTTAYSSASAAETAPAARLVADFASGVPDLASVPREAWAWAVREACQSAPNAEFDYGDPAGSPRLREVPAAYLRRVRAADTSAGQLVICSGMAQGLGLVLRALAGQGLTRVGFEDPGPVASMTATAAWAGIEAVPVPVDDHGVDVAALESTKAGAVVLTPAHQWPTGVVLAPERRLALADWAARQQAVIIEDDYDAEFRYDRNPVGTLQGLAPDRVIAPRHRQQVPRPGAAAGLDHQPAWPGQRALPRETGHRPRIPRPGPVGAGPPHRVRPLRPASAADARRIRHPPRCPRPCARRARPRRAGNRPGGRLSRRGPPPLGTAEQEVIRAARARSVGLYGMSTHRATHAPDPPQLVLGFGNTGALAGAFHGRARGATIRSHLIAVAARVARHGRGDITLHLPEGWHREQEWMNLFDAACGPPARAA
jgi:GntR family transcriptional regulator/MocR family aminotransferase